VSSILSFARDNGSNRCTPSDEPVEMRRRRYGYFPEMFIHRGHHYEVYAVERCWTVSRPKRGGRVERHCFRVRCREGVFELFQDVRHNTWHGKTRATSPTSAT
jgi:hypothetical protein